MGILLRSPRGGLIFTTGVSSRSTIRREGDSPKVGGFFVVVDELNSVGRHSMQSSQPGNDSRRYASATLVSYQDDSPHLQLTIELNRGSVPIQVRRFGRHLERRLLPIFAGQTYWSVQRHPIAAALCDRTANRGTGCDSIFMVVGLPAVYGRFEVHAEMKH